MCNIIIMLHIDATHRKIFTLSKLLVIFYTLKYGEFITYYISCRVAIGFYGSKTIERINKISDKSGRIILDEATIDETLFLLINIYNANTESEELETLSDLVL